MKTSKYAEVTIKETKTNFGLSQFDLQKGKEFSTEGIYNTNTINNFFLLFCFFKSSIVKNELRIDWLLFGSSKMIKLFLVMS